MYLVGTVYNFCSVHASRRLEDGGRQTPAMAAGITDHIWSVSELLHRRVPLPGGSRPGGAQVPFKR